LYFAKKIKLFFRLLFSCFIGFLKIDFQKNNLLILNYHNFDNSKNINDEMYVSYKNFEKQIIYFKENNYLTSFNDFFNKKKYKSKKKQILITIDDADFSIKKIITIINKHKVSVILFLPFGLLLPQTDINYFRSICLHHYFFINVNKKNKLKFELFFEKIMKLKINELKKISKDLSYKNKKKDYIINRKKISLNYLKKVKNNKNITLASHSMSHILLSKIPNKWLKWEITTSLKYLKYIKGEKEIFALPYGNYNSFSNTVVKILTINKIKYIFTTIGKLNNKTNILGRSFLLNSKNEYYLRGVVYGSMHIFDKILFRIKNYD